MTGRSGPPRPSTPRAGTPRPEPSRSSTLRPIPPSTGGPSSRTAAVSQVPERESPATQNRLIDSWLSDQHDLIHSKPAEFWASVDWDRDVVQRAFIDTLRQVAEEEYPRLQRSINRLSGENGWRIPYLSWDRVYTWTVKRDFWYYWFHQDEIDDWSLDKIKEWFTYLKDETYWVEAFKNKCEGREVWLNENPTWARYHPPGFIIQRWSRSYP